MKIPVGKIIGGVVTAVLLFFGLSSCNLFGESTGGYECPEGGCVGDPDSNMEQDFEYIVP
jgi:hypothetical protein